MSTDFWKNPFDRVTMIKGGKMKAKKRMTGVARCLITATIFVFASLTAQAERSPAAITQYMHHSRCGIVAPMKLPPLTYARGDIDADGTTDHFFANWGVIERHRIQNGARQPSSDIPITVRESIVYSSTTNEQYTCVDLRLHDIDSDGDLDMVYASPRELVVLENRGGRFTLKRQEPQSFAREADVRIQIRGSNITVKD